MCEVEVFKGSFDFHSHYFSVQKKKKKKKKKKKIIIKFADFIIFWVLKQQMIFFN